MQQSTFTIPQYVIGLIQHEGYGDDVIKAFTEYCQGASQTFDNYDPDDTPEHLWEAYESCMYPYKVVMKDGSVMLRFAQNDKDLVRDVLPMMRRWESFGECPVFPHP